MRLDRCSLNSATVRGFEAVDVIEAARTHGFGGVGLWRDVVNASNAREIARRAEGAGLSVTSLCRGGMFTAASEPERARAHDDNRAAVDLAHALSAKCVVLVCGGVQPLGLATARARIADGVAELADYARKAGVALAVEPMHPMMIADRSAITSLTEALALLDDRDLTGVGVVVDAYHLWWDDRMSAEIARAGSRILSVQVSDWITPIQGELRSRGMPGEGVIDLSAFLSDVDAAGYSGLVEVEVLSDQYAGRPDDALIAALNGLSRI